jgi:NIPSNAP protein
MAFTCFIRYEIDPTQLDGYAEYAGRLLKIIPRLGGELLGYFLPYEGTNYVAMGVIGFENLADYESYRARLKTDPEMNAAAEFAKSRRLILKEERSFLQRLH